MKLLATIRQPHQSQTRAGSREPNTTDRVDETSNQAFDGVLAKVVNKQARAEPIGQSPGTDLPKQGDSSRQAAAADWDHQSPILDVRGGSSSGSKQVATDGADESDGTVGKLLTRLKSKDEDDSSTPKVDANAPASDLSFMPGLAANPQAPPRAGEGHIGAKTADDAQTSAAPTPELSGGAGRTDSGAAPQAETALVLGVSVSTHIAPSKGDEGRPQPSDGEHLPPTQHAGEHSATSAGAGSSSHDDRPPEDGKAHAAFQKKVEASVATAGTVAPQAPIRAIAASMAELASRAASAAAAPDNPKGVSTAAAHTVILQMSPADLGTVEIRLHLTGHALDVQLTISEQRTLGLVARERDALAKALEVHHYELNSLVIQDGSAASPSGGTHVAKHESSGNAHPERQSGGSDGPGAQTSRDGRRGQDTERRARSDLGSRGDAPAPSRVADGRSLFI